jgi:Immunity protein 49
MKTIARHVVDRELVDEGVERFSDTLAKVVQAATGRAEALSIVLDVARSYAGYLSASTADQAELCRALRIGAQAAAAIFALGSGSGDIRIRIDDHHATLAATGPTDATHPGNWRIGWWLAHIVDDRSGIDVLATTPIDVLRGSSSSTDECQYRFVEALQGYQTHAADWWDKLQAALDATDPEKVNLADEEFVLNILLPEMQMLFRLALGEIAPFETALEFALERHKKYWSKASRKKDPDGFLGLGPLALASTAFKAGMPITTESDYIPRILIENACGQD